MWQGKICMNNFQISFMEADSSGLAVGGILMGEINWMRGMKGTVTMNGLSQKKLERELKSINFGDFNLNC